MLGRVIPRRLASFKPAVITDLPYDYNELAPVLSKDVLETHHGKHHVKYVAEFNMYMEKMLNAEAKHDFSNMLKFADKVAFNGGGHFNHDFYWKSLSPMNKNGGVLPNLDSPLGDAVKLSFGSFDNLIARTKKIAVDMQGTGWAWLAWDPITKGLVLAPTRDQETISQKDYVPLLTIDVWEHAYYLDYKNQKPAYMDEIWKIIDWKTVEARFEDAPNQAK